MDSCRSSVFVWIGESELETTNRIRVDANILCGFSHPDLDSDSCGRGMISPSLLWNYVDIVEAEVHFKCS